jgi:hypothetical protein
MAREPTGGGQQEAAAPADTAQPQPDAQPQAAAQQGSAPTEDKVKVRARATIYEEDNFQGRQLYPGDEAEILRGRAVELRAQGFVEFLDQTMEDEAKKNDPAPSTDNGRPVITSRSFRRSG